MTPPGEPLTSLPAPAGPPARREPGGRRARRGRPPDPALPRGVADPGEPADRRGPVEPTRGVAEQEEVDGRSAQVFDARDVRGRRIASAVLYPSVLLAAALSGLLVARVLRWPVAVDPAEPPAPQPSSGQARRATRPAGPERRAAMADAGRRRPRRDGPVGRPRRPSIPRRRREYPIDLTTALRLAEVENPLIAEARQRIGEALALQQRARRLAPAEPERRHELPRPHGQPPAVVGADPEARREVALLRRRCRGLWRPARPRSRPSTSSASSPTPSSSRWRRGSRSTRSRFGASATANRILLEVAELHFELLAAEADLRVRRESAEQEAEVARLTRAYAQAKQGREADAERAATELSLIEREVRQAEEEVAVASARLARRLHLDQSVRLRPVAPAVETVTIVDPAAPLPDLIAGGHAPPARGRRAGRRGRRRPRPGTGEERYRPLLPTLWLGFSGGAFGGGSNLVGPQLGDFARPDRLRRPGLLDRSATSARATSRSRSGGGPRSARRSASGRGRSPRSAARSARRTPRSLAARQRVDVDDPQLASAEAGFREDLERIRNTVGRPIEVVNSLQLLNQARVARIRAVTDYNKAEFRLFVALGSPPPLGAPPAAPIPPAPIASPPLPPLAAGSSDTPAAVVASTTR